MSWLSLRIDDNYRQKILKVIDLQKIAYFLKQIIEGLIDNITLNKIFHCYMGQKSYFRRGSNVNRFGKPVSNFNLLLQLIQLQYQFSKMQHQQKLGNFINKLHYLLSNSQYSEIICWDKTETMIDILCFEKMEKEIIPFYFRHQKFESFVRQLNLYGFKKVKFIGRHRFTHSQLLKGEKLLSITSHKSGSAKKDQKEHFNEHLSHEKTSESAGNNPKPQKASPPTLNSITQCQNEVTRAPKSAPSALNSIVSNVQEQPILIPAYPQQFFNFWNMYMMQAANQMGGYLIVNPMQTQQ